ncbi:Alpha-ketoglutarate-dependent dioxygenase alkB 6 [Entomortierella beljakovae]|nr:Alpha-ketoglutarate-dependent dioxygenase alkB 6 [Entomortierella beljakovae]
MIAEPLPTWLTELFPKFQDSQVFEGLDQSHFVPNHCLVNEYLAGQGIMPHKDGPAYLPTVATISLSSHCVLEFFKSAKENEDEDEGNDEKDADQPKEGLPTTDKKHSKEPVFSLLVQPRSLLILKEDAYNTYMHGIREVLEDDLRERNILNLPVALPEGINDENSVMKRETRISLTFRIVHKTISSSKFFLRK